MTKEESADPEWDNWGEEVPKTSSNSKSKAASSKSPKTTKKEVDDDWDEWGNPKEKQTQVIFGLKF